jgi:hypothetical protein
MNSALAVDPALDEAREEQATSLDASDDFELPAHSSHYCPTELLGSFTLLMAGHGRCVSSSMMLGDREYAMWQLARAQTMADDELRRVASRLFTYFDDAHGWGHRY